MRYRLAAVLVALAAGVGLPLAGCGGDDEGAGTTDLFDTGIFDTGTIETTPETETEPVDTQPGEAFQIKVPKEAPIGPQSPTEKIAEVQEALLLLGYNIGEADGIWGEKTKKAVVKFQKKHKLKADGLVGTKTAKLINKELRKLASG
ncbi:MAG: peptidoglycan-binding protein [Thermoleophilia bacterium]|nr:peptidoglycan-binding protein [Thermoleophilia bacterium]